MTYALLFIIIRSILQYTGSIEHIFVAGVKQEKFDLEFITFEHCYRNHAIFDVYYDSYMRSTKSVSVLAEPPKFANRE